MKKIFLITKLKTSNIGNEALSYEIANMFKKTAKNAIIHTIGRPFGLDGYLPSRLLKVKNPLAEFEKWTDAISENIKKLPKREFIGNDVKVTLYQTQAQHKIDRWKSLLRPIKKYINSKRIYSHEYGKRAALLKEADWLIYSGAGEVTDGYRGNFNDAHVFIRQMIEIRVAQKLGIQTAAVNQSIFVNLPLSRQIIASVYRHMKKIVVRGTSSRDCLIEYGVPSHLIEMAPDSAINTPFENAGKVVKNNNWVGLNFSNHVKFSDEGIRKILDCLQGSGKKVFYCTNEPIGDYAIIKKLKEEFNIPLLEGFSNYKEYAACLSKLDFVISARVHTNMLSLISHTTVIPIEGNDFRLQELLEGFEYPFMPVKSQLEGWEDLLIVNVRKVLENEINFDSYFRNVFASHQKDCVKNATWINEF